MSIFTLVLAANMMVMWLNIALGLAALYAIVIILDKLREVVYKIVGNAMAAYETWHMTCIGIQAKRNNVQQLQASDRLSLREQRLKLLNDVSNELLTSE